VFLKKANHLNTSIMSNDMNFLEKRPQKTYLVRLTEDELQSMHIWARKRNMSVNQCFRMLAHNLKESKND